jgi:putative Ca2+/H+ antiporter (TMEM165/GDT1 family)
MRWILGVSFLAMAVWVLIPDKLGDDEADTGKHPWGVFAITAWVFFLAEMGDKTQIATVALGAQYANLVAVVAGTTLGMMLANAPVVFWGEALTRRIPIRALHIVAAVIFFALGLAVLWGAV